MTREELMKMSKKDLKNRLAELGKKAQALSGQELTDAMDEARNIGEILDEIKTREELMAAAAAAGNNDPEPGKGSKPGEGGEEPKNQVRAKNGKALKDGKAVSYKAKVLVNPRNAMTTERVAMPQHSSTEISPAFNNVSSLIDRVKTVPLPGGESYKRPYVVSYGDGAGSTKYTKDWTHGVRQKRASAVTGLKGYTVYNKKYYQLTHLLEKGHQSRNGGRVKAFEHIGPVNETLGDLATQKIERKVRG